MDYAAYFVTRKRQDGTEYVSYAEGAPEELKEFVRRIHMDHFYGALPNDWIYKVIAEAFEGLANDDIDNVTIEADIYTHDLLCWLYENGQSFALQYCAEWLDQFSDNQGLDIAKQIEGGQWLAKNTIYIAVHEFLEEKKQ